MLKYTILINLSVFLRKLKYILTLSVLEKQGVRYESWYSD